MSLITPRFLDCVVAIGKDDSKGGVHWMGTGFLFGYKLPNVQYANDDIYSVFLVSNKHVLCNQDQIYLRFNPQGGQPAHNYPLQIVDGTTKLCKLHPDDNVDVAVVNMPQTYFDNLVQNGVKPQFFRFDKDCYTTNGLRAEEISEGDNVYALGFPMGIVGNTRQYVMLRGGVIARIHDMLEGYSSDFIVDAPVFPGNSGGPVIIKPELTRIEGTKSHNESRLIGLVKTYITYKDIAISPQTGRPRVVFEENTGLTNVEPVDHIIETILQK